MQQPTAPSLSHLKVFDALMPLPMRRLASGKKEASGIRDNNGAIPHCRLVRPPAGSPGVSDCAAPWADGMFSRIREICSPLIPSRHVSLR